MTVGQLTLMKDECYQMRPRHKNLLSRGYFLLWDIELGIAGE